MSYQPGRARVVRLGLTALFVVNVGVVGFSVVGSWALESGAPVPPWDYERLSSALAVLNITTAFAIAALHMIAFQGLANSALLLGLCVVIAGGCELLGTTTGFPFGHYEYTGKLGPRLGGWVPYAIPLAWFTITYPALTVAGELAASRPAGAILAAAMVTLWDVALDPAMTAKFPAWVWAGSAGFYGIPFRNWLAWFAVAWVIAAAYGLAARRQERPPSRLPWALYSVQSLLPAILAAIYGRGGATLVWAAGFAALAVGRYRAFARTAPAAGTHVT